MCAAAQERVRVCLFIRKAARLLKLPQRTTSTALSFYHRYAGLCPPCDDFDNNVRDVVTVCHVASRGEVMYVGPEYWAAKDAVVRAEQHVLRVLAFDLSADLPHTRLLHHVRSLGGSPLLLRAAWAAVSDAMLTEAAARHGPAALAAGAVLFACAVRGEDLQRQRWMRPWWEAFGVKRADAEDVCSELARLYAEHGVRAVQQTLEQQQQQQQPQEQQLQPQEQQQQQQQQQQGADTGAAQAAADTAAAAAGTAAATTEMQAV
eukprot:m51a1_g2007 hypothetical protein (262) ;mRNA; r:1246219-1247391